MGSWIGAASTGQHDFEIYLKNQWNRFVLPEGDNGREIASKFLEGMLRLDKFMGNRFAKEYQQSVLRPRTNLRFIVFNYTDMLEQMWNSILPQQGNEFHFFEAIANNTRFSVDVSQPCFVHGVLSRSKYLFGVDMSVNGQVRLLSLIWMSILDWVMMKQPMHLSNLVT